MRDRKACGPLLLAIALGSLERGADTPKLSPPRRRAASAGVPEHQPRGWICRQLNRSPQQARLECTVLWEHLEDPRSWNFPPGEGSSHRTPVPEAAST